MTDLWTFERQLGTSGSDVAAGGRTQRLMRLAIRRALARLAVILPVPLLLFGCVAQPPAGPGDAVPKPPPAHVMALSRSPFEMLPGWGQDHPSAALPAFLAGCAAMTPPQSLGGQGDAARLGGSAAQWRASVPPPAPCRPVTTPRRAEFFERAFPAIRDHRQRRAPGTVHRILRARGARRAARAAAPYHTPLLARPPTSCRSISAQFADDLKGRKIAGRVQDGRLVPYFDRAAIAGGALGGRRLELLWLADPIDAFFLEIQGSGRVPLPDGSVVRVELCRRERPSLRRRSAGCSSTAARSRATRSRCRPSARGSWRIPARRSDVMDQQSVLRLLPRAERHARRPGAARRARRAADARAFACGRPRLPAARRAGLARHHRSARRRADAPLDGRAGHRRRDQGAGARRRVLGLGPDAEARAGKMKSQGAAYVLLPRAETGPGRASPAQRSIAAIAWKSCRACRKRPSTSS